MFTTNTETGERTCVPAFLSSGSDHRVLVGSWSLVRVNIV
jgi:hypothetical protein